MKFDRYLDYFLTVLTLGCALPGWIQLLLQKGKRMKLWPPVALMTIGVLITATFEYLVTFGSLNLNQSLRFAAEACPCSILAIVLARSKKVGRAAPWIWFGAGGTLVLWWVLITAA